MKRLRNEIFAALDIGSSKIACVIAVKEQNLKVIGYGYHEARGINNGVITDTNTFEESVLSSVQKAEKMSGHPIKNTIINAPSNKNIVSEIIKKEIMLNNDKITENEIKTLMKRVGESQDEIIHLFPTKYILDGQSGIVSPIGMTGSHLVSHIHRVTYPKVILNNINLAIKRCHIKPIGYVENAYAAALSVLVKDEMMLGTTIVDIGTNGSSIASFVGGVCVSIGYIPIGSHHITMDLVHCLSISVSQAERIKTLHGNLLKPIKMEKPIIIHKISDSDDPIEIQREEITDIIKSRTEEIIEHINIYLTKTQLIKQHKHYIVLTGGGSILTGLRDVAQNILNQPVRIGYPIHIDGLNEVSGSSSFATVMGLLEYFCINKDTYNVSENSSGIFSKITRWWRGL
jgi:cell division protein FtsA